MEEASFHLFCPSWFVFIQKELHTFPSSIIAHRNLQLLKNLISHRDRDLQTIDYRLQQKSHFSLPLNLGSDSIGKRRLGISWYGQLNLRERYLWEACTYCSQILCLDHVGFSSSSLKTQQGMWLHSTSTLRQNWSTVMQNGRNASVAW